MSKIVDERIVSMKFENAQFQNGIKDSIDSLNQFDKTLNKMDGSTKAFDNLEKSMTSVDVQVEKTQSKFKTFMAQLQQGFNWEIGRNIESYLSKLSMVSEVKTLPLDYTIGAVNEGWTKYAEKTQAVQTIMAATGQSIDDVTQQLERLNWFTDETSYSFRDMVNNIGKFTANGVELDKAVTAMEGISTWAAKSGQLPEVAGRVMYNVSQALGMGYMATQDWRSVEMANMATKEFKDTVLETAAELGALQKDVDGSYYYMKETAKEAEKVIVNATNFRSTLEGKWFTNDVMIGTFKRYGDFADALSAVMAKYEDYGIYASDALKMIASISHGMGTEVQQNLHKMFDGMEGGDAIAEALLSDLEDLADSEYDFGRKAFVAAQEAKTFSEAITSVKDALSTRWSSIFESMFGNYEVAKQVWTNLSNQLYDIFVEPMNAISGAFKNLFGSQWDKLTSKLKQSGIVLEDYKAALIEVGSERDSSFEGLIEEAGGFDLALQNGIITVKDLDDALNRLTNGGYLIDAEKDAEKIKMTLADLQKMVDEVRKGDHGTGSARVQWFESMGYDPKLAQEMVDRSAIRKLTEADLNEFTATQTALRHQVNLSAKSILEVRKLILSFQDNWKSVSTLFTGSFATIIDCVEAVVSAITEGFYAVENSRFAESFRALLNNIIFAFDDLYDYLSENSFLVDIATNIFTAVSNIATSINNILGPAITWAVKLFKNLVQFIAPPVSFITKLISDVTSFIADRVKFIMNILNKYVSQNNILETFAIAWEHLWASLDKGYEKVKEFLSGIVDLETFGDSINEWVIKPLRNLLGVFKMSIFKKLSEIKTTLKEFFKELPTTLRNLSEQIKTFLGPAFEWIKAFIKSIPSLAASVYAWFKQIDFTPVMNFLKELRTTLTPIMLNIISKIKIYAEKIYSSISDLWTNVLKDKLVSVVGTLWNLIKNIFGILTGKGPSDNLLNIKSIINGIVEKVKELWGKVTELIKSVNLSKIKTDIENVAISFATAISNFFAKIDWQQVGNTIINGIKKLFENGGAVIMAIFGFMGTIGKAIIDGLGQLDWKAILDTVLTSVGGIFASVAKLVGGFFKGIIDKIQNATANSTRVVGANATGAITGMFGGVFKAIKDYIKENLPNFSSLLSSTWKPIKDTFTDIGASIKSGWEKVYNFIKPGVDKIKSILAPFIDFFKTFFNTLKSEIADKTLVDKIKTITDIIYNIGMVISSIKIARGWGKISTSWVQLFKNINTFSSEWSSTITDSLKSWNSANVIKNIQNGVNIFSSLTTMFSRIGSAIDSWRKYNNARIFKEVAKGFLILVVGMIAVIGGIFLLQKMYERNAEAVKQAATTMIAIMVATAAIVAAVGFIVNLANAENSKAIGTIFALAGFMVSILALAFAIKKIGELPEDIYNTAVDRMTAIGETLFVAITILTFLSKSFNFGSISIMGQSNMAGVGLAFVGLAAALIIIAKAFEMIASLNLSKPVVDRVSNIIYWSIAVLAVAMSAMELAAGFSGLTSGAGLGVAALSLSLLILAGTIALLVKICKDNENISAYVPIMWEMVGMIAVLAIAAALIGASTGKFKAGIKAGLGALLFAASLNIIADAALKLMNVKYTTLIKIGLFIGAFLTLLTIVSVIASIENTEVIKAGIGMIAMAGALYLMSFAFDALSRINYAKAAPGIILAIGVILATCALLMSLSEISWKLLSLPVSIMIIAGVIAALAYVMSQIPPIDPKNTLFIGVAIVALGAVAIIMALVSKTLEKADLGKFAILMGVFAVVMVILCAALIILAQASELAKPIDENFIITFAALAAGILAIMIVFGILEKSTGIMSKAILPILILGVVLVLLGEAMKLIAEAASIVSGVEPAALEFIEIVLTIALLFEVMAMILIAILSSSGPLGVLATLLTAALTAGVIVGIIELCKSLGEAASALSTMFTSIQGFDDPSVVENFSANMETLIGLFKDGVFNWSVLDGAASHISQLGTALTMLSNAMLNGGINAVIAVDWSTLSQQIRDFSISIIETTAEIKKHLPEMDTAIADEILVLTELTPQFDEIGVGYVASVARGMSDSTALGLVAEAGWNIGQTAAASARAAAKEKSPSKVFAQIGAYMTEGLAIGMIEDKVTKKIEEAASSMISSVVEGAKNSIGDKHEGVPSIIDQLGGDIKVRLSDITSGDVTEKMFSDMTHNITDAMENSLDNQMDLEITPIVDMSSIESDLGNLDSMFGDYSIPVSGNIDTISGTMNSTLVNSKSNDPVVVKLDASSINALMGTTQDGSVNPIDVNVTYTGSLAYLAQILQPAIEAESNRVGLKFVN